MASMVNLPLTSWTILAILTWSNLLQQFMDVSSLQEVLPSPDLPAFLDGLPERWFSSSSCAYIPSASHGMLSLSINNSISTVHIKTTGYDWNNLMYIQVDYRALSSRAWTLRCGKLLPSAACFSVKQLSLFRLIICWYWFCRSRNIPVGTVSTGNPFV